MSITKETVKLPSATIWKPTEVKHDDEKINHVYHKLTELYEELKINASCQAKKHTKYDLICRNVDEALVLLSYREKSNEVVDKKMKKFKKFFNKI